MSHEEISDQILKHVSRREYRPQRVRALAREMGIEEEDYQAFRATVKTLMHEGRVIVGHGNAVMVPEPTGRIVGTFRGHRNGFGFVVPESPGLHSDLYVPKGRTLDAITGDTVMARVLRKGKRAGQMLFEGEILEVLERGHSRFVGELQRDGDVWSVRPDGKTLQTPIVVRDVSATRARRGDQVVVEITEYPRGPRAARGVIVEVLGRRGDPGVDTISMIRQFHLPAEFPDNVLAEARRVIGGFDVERELASREDLRDVTTITIDPDDAKDFDDAISLRRVGRGFELGVHIADVSAFVRSGGKLDAETRLRGNSTYFPGFVIPMLPEVLSNGLCSLQQGEPRLVKSAWIRYDAKGRRQSSRVGNSVIESNRRLTYGEADAILRGKTGGYPKGVVELLRGMETLARRIRERRLKDGMIVLDLPEVELVLDDDGEVIGVEPADTSFPHTIIEMFMVEANEVVAELLDGLGVPFLRRIHPEPPASSNQRLTQFVKVLGHKLPRSLDREQIRGLLEHVRGRPEAFAVNLAVLRSMERAEYSPKSIGHFALASRHYCHFTSPIRRYPDLSVHRLLDRYLAGGLRTRRDRGDAPSKDEVVELGAHCSFTERRSEDAERELRTVKILRLLERRVGEVFDGVVTGVTNIGVFVQLTELLIDGLIRFSVLPDDWWELDAGRGCVVGQRSGRRIHVGDAMAVQIAAVDVPGRQLDLIPAPERRPARPSGTARPAKRSTSRARRSGQPAPRKKRAVGRKAKRGR